jgi:4-diphosphocytidyl-2-C-methyl-D-erythritol kinase
VTQAKAPAKINLALVVGPARADGKHEVATVLQRLDLCDTIHLEPSDELRVEGFAEDTLVRQALEALAAAAGVDPRWAARIEKQIPVAAGLGGGSSDAATALRLANDTLVEPLSSARLHELAGTLGADVPFFLEPGPQLGTGDGSTLAPLELPQDYSVLLLLPSGAEKESTASVYARFDGAEGFAARRARVLGVTRAATAARDLAELPANDLASSPLAGELLAAGAFRADVSGAGPAVYGLFDDRAAAERASSRFASRGRLWILSPAWYV